MTSETRTMNINRLARVTITSGSERERVLAEHRNEGPEAFDAMLDGDVDAYNRAVQS